MNSNEILNLNNVIQKNSKLTPLNIQFGLRNHPVHVNAKSSSGKKYLLKFIDAEFVEGRLIQSLFRLETKISKNTSIEKILDSLAQFYFEFIFIIHPFSDGNGRTARYILSSVLDKFGLYIPSFYLLRSFCLTGNMKQDYDNLRESLKLSVIAS